MQFLAPLVAGIFSGISYFLASRGAWILASLGIGFATMKGMQTITGFIIADMNTAIGAVNTASGAVGGHNVGVFMAKFAAYCGLFDALNIMLGGFMALYGMVGLRVIMRKLTG
ncbi:hypothetical protein GPA22_17665 [Aromatoleum toluvorans]|uniref:Uncharacterized protein n=1 Tax=Aromatoleum toluvorans TaxID=92002 RepID=A0ABX1Q4W0_9RHOO|nr:DUF2523 family protein [Aromatoleum toluvorans]NMG45545.1 hypothetical protein [Aromatoleum toluvorans]